MIWMEAVSQPGGDFGRKLWRGGCFLKKRILWYVMPVMMMTLAPVGILTLLVILNGATWAKTGFALAILLLSLLHAAIITAYRSRGIKIRWYVLLSLSGAVAMLLFIRFAPIYQDGPFFSADFGRGLALLVYLQHLVCTAALAPLLSLLFDRYKKWLAKQQESED